jgi:hypothetical protein
MPWRSSSGAGYLASETILEGITETATTGRLPSYKIGILVKNKIKTNVIARTDEEFVFAKNKGIERASIFRSNNSNVYAVLAALQ